jgi:hypothetical protein
MKGRNIIYTIAICIVLCSLVGFVSIASEQISILNPRPSRPPITAQPIAPRLSSIEEKTIAVIANYNNTMAPIAEELVKTIPNIKVIFISDLPVAPGQSPRPFDLEPPISNMSLEDFEKDPQVADAAILGNGF